MCPSQPSISATPSSGLGNDCLTIIALLCKKARGNFGFSPVFLGKTPCGAVAAHPHPLAIIQPHLVGDHGNELAVGGLSAQVVDGVAEVAVQRVHIAPVPCHLDGMADGALHPAGGGTVALGDLRVQALGHRVDILRLVHREQDGVPQKLVTLDVSGHTIRVGQ